MPCQNITAWKVKFPSPGNLHSLLLQLLAEYHVYVCLSEISNLKFEWSLNILTWDRINKRPRDFNKNIVIDALSNILLLVSSVLYGSKIDIYQSRCLITLRLDVWHIIACYAGIFFTSNSLIVPAIQRVSTVLQLAVHCTFMWSWFCEYSATSFCKIGVVKMHWYANKIQIYICICVYIHSYIIALWIELYFLFGS